MPTETAYFPVGSSYYPPFHTPVDWERDTANMQRAGLNLIRTAELLTSWDYIEPRRGEPDFSWLDQIFQLASRNQIQILLGTGSCNPPIWMIEQYPDLQRVSREGVPYPTNTVWGWACVNHPGLRNEVLRWLNGLIDRYSQNPTLFGWQIDNEIGQYPAYSGSLTRDSRSYAYYCYCNHCARLFREWVKTKYQDIEALNYAWSWDPTHYRYYDWHQIEPPRSMPAEWGNGTAWLDFRRFVHQSHTNFIRFQQELLERRDPLHPTVANLLVHSALEKNLGAMFGIDHWQLAGVPHAIGYDIYPRALWKSDPAFTSRFLDFAKSVAHHNHRPLWITELESGPIGKFSAGPVHTTRASDIRRYNLACLGHGAKMMLYQGYRDWNCIPLTWGALVDFHGDPTYRFDAVTRLNRVIEQNQDFFLNAQPARAKIALYHSQENVAVLDGQANTEFLYNALTGAYNALWQHKFTLEFIAPQFVGGDTCDYKVIILPFAMHMPKRDADGIKQFVEQGGSVIGFAKLAHLDEKGWAWNDRPGAGLDELFGARETDIFVYEENDDAVNIRVDPHNSLFEGISAEQVNGYWHRQEFKLTADIEILARFIDGAPAIMRRAHGKGQAILCATHLDMAAQVYDEPAQKRLLANLMTLCGVEPDVLLKGEPRAYIEKRVDAHLLLRNKECAVLLTNEGEQPIDLTVTLPGNTSASRAHELLSDQMLGMDQTDGARFTVHLPAADGVMVMLQ